MADVAVAFGEALTGAVDKAARSVLRVETHRRRGASAFAWSEGRAITAAHVLDGEDEVQIAGEDGASRTARIVGRDPATDVALLEVEGGGLAPLEMRDDAGIRVGLPALALARPGRSIRASLRIVGVLGSDVRTPGGSKLERWIETDRGIPRGFAGGPLIDLEGRGIGMSTAAIVRGADLAIARVTLERVIAELSSHGHVRRGFIGVHVQPVMLPKAVQDASGHRTGALVLGVRDGSPAAAAGILLGDVFLELDGQPVHGPGALTAILADRVGAALPARVLRAGAIVDATVTPADRSAP